MQWFIVLVMLVVFKSSAFAEGLSGWANINYNTTKQFEDGEKTVASDTFNRNFYLNFDKSITPMLSHHLYLRTNLSDSDSTNSEGMTTTTYQRVVEPAIDFFLQNPMYNLGVGYRREEQWSSAHLRNDSRETTEFYYSRFNIAPHALPSLSLQVDRQKNYDHLSIKNIDSTATTYTGNSAQQFSYRNLNLRYNLTYTHSVNETPKNITTESIDDNFSAAYNLDYSSSFWVNKASLSVGYQGNYARNRNKQFVAQTGSVLFERTPYLGGLYIQDTTPDEDDLGSEPLLINGNYKDTTGIKLNNTYQNIGIWITFKTVDRLYIYYKNDGLADSITWRIYWSNNNINWSFITETIVSPTYDSINDAYRYEIVFSATSAYYFKAVNLDTVSQVGGSDVEVTEIEAYGTDVVPETGTITAVSTFFTQQLNIGANLKPLTKLNFSFNYSIDRADQNPVSPWDSISGIFANILSKSEAGGEEGLRSDVTRTYGVTSTWIAHRLLTTTLRLQKTEAFDNKNETDLSSDTYSLSFNSAPLPTLDTNLSLIRSDRYSFDEKESTNNSVLLSIGSRLYRDLNMITDAGYTQSKSFITETESSTHYLRGSLDALLTTKLSASLRYSFDWTSSGTTSSKSKDGSTLITYRAGSFINLSGKFSVADADGNITTSEGFFIDWLPLPAIKLNLNYDHSRSEPVPSISDTFSGYGIWHITKFINAQLAYSYTQKVEEKETESHNFNANLNCRF